METRFCQGITKSFDPEKAEIYAWASRSLVDRDNEVILGTAWMHPDSTKGFEQSGSPLLIAHNYQAYPPLGRVTKLEKSEEGLKFRAKIAQTDIGKQVIRYIADTNTAAFSVGFQGMDSEDWGTEKLAKAGFDVSEATTDRIKVWTRARLFEISIVSVPALSSATIIGEKYAKGEIVEKSLLSALNGWKDGHTRKDEREEIIAEVRRILLPRIAEAVGSELERQGLFLKTAIRQAQLEILKKLGKVIPEDQEEQIVEKYWPGTGTPEKKPEILEGDAISRIMRSLLDSIRLEKK